MDDMHEIVEEIRNEPICKTIRKGCDEPCNLGAFQPLLDALPFYVILVDENHIIHLANNAVKNHLGVDPRSIIGGYCPKIIHGIDGPFPGCPLEESMAKGQSIERELFDENTDHWYKSAIYPTTILTEAKKRLFFHTTYDITELKKTQHRVEEYYQIQSILSDLLTVSLQNISLDAMLDKILERMITIPWFKIESKGTIHLVDHNAHILTLRTFIGVPEPIQTMCSQVPMGRCLCGKTAQTKKIVFSNHIDEAHENRYDGMSLHGHYCVPIIYNDDILGVMNLYVKEGHHQNKKEEDFLLIASNVIAGIIKRKQAEEELSVLNKELEDKVKTRTGEIETLLKQKDEYIHMLGHDLKNPLLPLLILLPLVEKKIEDPELKEWLNVSLRNAQLLKEMLTKTLDDALQDKLGMKLDMSDINIYSEVTSLIDGKRTFFSDHNITIENRIDENIVINGDKMRIDEIFENLFTNAVKYSKEHGGCVTIDAEPIEDFIQISIKDDGIGIAENQINHIFDEFFKTNTARNGMESHGLGLYICRKIVEKHGGKIWAESEGVGKGCTVYFTVKTGRKGSIGN